MKKRLEAELISIAHRVLKLKNKSEVDQLYHETQKLYEALTVLKFYGNNYERVNAEISSEDIEGKIESFIENKVVIKTPASVVEEKIIAEEIPTEEPVIVAKEEVLIIEDENLEEIEALKEIEEESETEEEPIIVGEIILEEEEIEEEIPVGEAKTDLDFESIFEMTEASSEIEIPIEEPIVKENENLNQVQIKAQQISFEDLLGQNYSEPIFVKPNDVTIPKPKKEIVSEEIIVEKLEEKSKSLNDRLSKSINIGLNDRVGFVKHLFNESTEDYNRVLSQLNTFGTFEEAKDFIEEIIKPDYNNWEGKEDYEIRFLEIVEKKFQ